MTRSALDGGRLTFGDDGSAGADVAWEWVTAQVWPSWQVDVLQGAATPSLAGTDSPATRWAPSRCGFASIRTVTSPLDPKLALASHSGTDLVVIGPHRLGTDRLADLGGTARALVMEGEMPVVVAHAADPVRSVVACFDGSVNSQAALEALALLPLSRTSTVTLLTVRSLADEASSESSAAASRAASYLADLGVRASIRAAEPASSAVLASPAHRILDFADRTRPDLVVLGRSGKGTVGRLVNGSVSAHVAGKATCSVLVAGTRGD